MAGIDWIDEYSLWPASVGLVAHQERCSERTVRNWASDNGIRTIGEGKKAPYIFFKQDVVNFRLRERPGRRWTDKE